MWGAAVVIAIVLTQNTAPVTCVLPYTQTLPPFQAQDTVTALHANHRVQAVLLQSPNPLISSCRAGQCCLHRMLLVAEDHGSVFSDFGDVGEIEETLEQKLAATSLLTSQKWWFSLERKGLACCSTQDGRRWSRQVCQKINRKSERYSGLRVFPCWVHWPPQTAEIPLLVSYLSSRG